MSSTRALVLNGDALRREVDTVRSRSKNITTNWFLSPLRAPETKAWSRGASLVFVDPEHDFERVYFATSDFSDLERALAAIPARSLVLDHFTRGAVDEGFARACENAGFRRVARYLRIKKTLVNRTIVGPGSEHAGERDVDLLYADLHRDFDVRLDYLPTRDELAELVRQSQVLTTRVGAAIAGYLVYRVEGLAAKWEYLGTRPDAPPAVASALVAAFDAELAEKKLRLVTGWVDERKRALLTAYDGLGYHEDGLTRTTFVKGQGFAPRDRAAVNYAIATPARASENDDAGDVRALVLAALAAVNDAVPKEMQVALSDGAPLSTLDSLALMNLLVGVEQAILENLEVEVRMSDAATHQGGAPLVDVGKFVAFAKARVNEARGRS